MAELLVGAGKRHEKRLCLQGLPEQWTELITLDMNPDLDPDVVHDLNVRPLPFRDDTFDEIHAYEVLEHLGRQGDWRAFFDEWSEWYRILKHGGVLIGTSPAQHSNWAWGDPGHTRVISPECLTFLNQDEYDRQIGITTMTDYRFCYKADFNVVHCNLRGETFEYGLQAVKPSRFYR
jgi:SAM-dependent methyltransferase